VKHIPIFKNPRIQGVKEDPLPSFLDFLNS
jgi:hypothetical protein